MADVLSYPQVTGFRHGFASVNAVFKLPAGDLEFRGFKSINYNRTRTRTKVMGNHVDPIAKTRGNNDYTCDAEVYVAEYMALIRQLGAGYGDIQFSIFVQLVEAGFENIQDEILGCTLDTTDASNSQGPDPLVRKIDFNPIKILLDGIEDVSVPLNQG